MSVWYNRSDGIRERFLEELSNRSYLSDRPNYQAHVVLNTIQEAFAPAGNCRKSTVTVTPELVHYLACCSWVALEYNKKEVVPYDEHDSVLTKALRSFMDTLEEAIRHGNFWMREGGEPYFGAFHIPEWFMDGVQAQMRQEAEWERNQ